MEVKAGKTICYDIWYTGEPAPIATWIKDDAIVEKDDRISIESISKSGIICRIYMCQIEMLYKSSISFSGTYNEVNSTLTITKANRRIDTGNYKIRLICPGGNSEATGFVNVVDVPTKPLGDYHRIHSK